MVEREEEALREAIRAAFAWMRERKPGPASLMWSTGDQPVPLYCDLVFPEIQLTDDESRFIADETRAFSVNAAAPPSLRALDAVSKALFPIGGELFLKRAGRNALVLRFAIRASDSEEDINAKVTVIQAELEAQLDAPHTGAPPRR